MDVVVREHGQSRYTVHVSLSADEVKGAFDRTYQQLSDRGGIRGFRPGKVPRSILERHYDYEVIRAGTYESLVQDKLQAALEENDLNPIDQINIEAGSPPDDDEALAETIKGGLVDEDPEADEEAEEELPEEEEDIDIPLVEGEAFDFYTSFTAYPRPQLPDLADLKLKRPIAEVTDEDVAERIERIRQASAEEVEVDRDTIEDGDLVVADIGIVLEDEDPDEASLNEQEIVIGDREYIGDLDKAMIGHKAGDTVEVPYEYPLDHPDEELAGKSARVLAEISSFSGRELPELDDEFARGLGNYDDLDDLRATLRDQLQQEADRQADQALHAQVLQFLAENTEVALPGEFVERAVQRSQDDLLRELQGVGMSLEEFIEASSSDPDEFERRQEEEAINTLTLHFATEALAREREIELDEEDMVQELQRIANDSGGDMQAVQQAAALQQGFGDEVRERAIRRKLIAEIVESAEIEDIPLEQYEAELESEEAGSEAAQPLEDADSAGGSIVVDDSSPEPDEEISGDTPNPSSEPAADENVQESESQ